MFGVELFVRNYYVKKCVNHLKDANVELEKK